MIKRQMLMLRNLNCPNCAARLEAAARRLPGMVAATVSFGTGALTVEYDPDRLTEERIRGLARQFGLEVAAALPAPARR